MANLLCPHKICRDLINLSSLNQSRDITEIHVDFEKCVVIFVHRAVHGLQKLPPPSLPLLPTMRVRVCRSTHRGNLSQRSQLSTHKPPFHQILILSPISLHFPAHEPNFELATHHAPGYLAYTVGERKARRGSSSKRARGAIQTTLQMDPIDFRSRHHRSPPGRHQSKRARRQNREAASLCVGEERVSHY